MITKWLFYNIAVCVYMQQCYAATTVQKKCVKFILSILHLTPQWNSQINDSNQAYADLVQKIHLVLCILNALFQ